MLFKPKSTLLWDTFILPFEGKYYLFYLQLRNQAWDGYGLAVSDDLIHWTDRGTVVESDPDVQGMGSGMVYRAGGKWLLNFSYGEEGSQRIYFAESNDLLNWRKLPRNIVCAPDPRWYETTGRETSNGARWDNIWVVPQEDGSFVGFVVASSKAGPAGANGVVGFVTSPDGLHWKVEPPVSEPCGMFWAEASCHLKFGPRHYLLVGSSTGLGSRFDPVYTAIGKAGGMYVMMSENIRGPYRLVEGDPMLLGCRNAPPNWAYIPTYYARVFAEGGQYLLYHHWMPRDNFLDAWLGAIKVLEEKEPGRLSIKYWPGNERLKGEVLFSGDRSPQPQMPHLQPIPSAKWEYHSGLIRGYATGSGLILYKVPEIYADGVVVEAEVTLNGRGAGGLFFGTEENNEQDPYQGVACLANHLGMYEFGRVVRSVAGPAFMPENHVLRGVPPGRPVRWRVLLRGEFIELYADDELVQCFGFSRPAVRNVGVFVERAEITVKNLNIYRFA